MTPSEHDPVETAVAVGFDGGAIVDSLNRLLRLRTSPVAMKRFRTVADMEQVPRLRRPTAIHTTDQIVGQAARNGWTVGFTADDLVGDQCAAVVGLHPRDDEWLAGRLTDAEAVERVERLRPIAERIDCTMAQLALAWCTLNPHVSTVITGASKVSQVEQNFGALDVIPLLTPEVKEEMEAAVAT